MKLTKATFLLALTTILVLAACGGRAQATNGADLQISLVAPSEGANAQYLIVQVADKAGKPITNATVNVEGNMQHAGMAPIMGKAVQDEADGKRSKVRLKQKGAESGQVKERSETWREQGERS